VKKVCERWREIHIQIQLYIQEDSINVVPLLQSERKRISKSLIVLSCRQHEVKKKLHNLLKEAVERETVLRTTFA